MKKPINRKSVKEMELSGSFNGAQTYREDKRMLADYMGKELASTRKPKKESATGHIGNSSGPSPANPLGSNSAPMEAAGDTPNKPLYIKVIGDTSISRKRQAKAADKVVGEAKEQKPNVIRNYVAKHAQKIAKGSGRHKIKTKYQRQDKHRNRVEEDLSWDDVNDVRKHADDQWNTHGANVKFTRHFLDRVNDPRNKTPITKPELERLVDKEASKYGNQIPKQPDGHEGVMVDRKTKINMPFAINQQTPGARKDVIAKTVMRKDNFMTSSRKYPVESVQEGVKVKMRSMKEDEPGFSDGVGAGPIGRVNAKLGKIDVRKGALFGEDDDGAYQMVKNPPDDDGAANEIADKGWYAEKNNKIDARSKAFKEAMKKAQERASKRTSKKKPAGKR